MFHVDKVQQVNSSLDDKKWLTELFSLNQRDSKYLLYLISLHIFLCYAAPSSFDLHLASSAPRKGRKKKRYGWRGFIEWNAWPNQLILLNDTLWKSILWTITQYKIPNPYISHTVALSNPSDAITMNIFSDQITYLATTWQKWVHRGTMYMTCQLQQNIQTVPQVIQCTSCHSCLGHTHAHFYGRAANFRHAAAEINETVNSDHFYGAKHKKRI